MNRRLRPSFVWLCGAAVVAVTCSSVTTPAAANDHGRLSAHFHLRGSHQYRIYVDAYRSRRELRAKGTRGLGRVTITAYRHHAAASYTKRARFNRHRMRADFGRFGKVALRWTGGTRSLAPAAKSPLQQRRDRTCVQRGSFVTGEFHGRFRFRGERGYTRAHAHRVRGELDRWGPPHCHGQDHGTKLTAKSPSVKFQAIRDDEYPVSFLVASTQEQVDRIRIDRYAYRVANSSKGEFTFDDGLTSAHVAPDADAFSGSADFAAPSSWSGSLSVSFPGRADVPLTGHSFVAKLARY
jgi:hypothetical protein